MWTDYSVMDRFETGRVYVVYQDKQVSQSQSQSSLSLVFLSAPVPQLWHVEWWGAQGSVWNLSGKPRRYQPWWIPRYVPPLSYKSKSKFLKASMYHDHHPLHPQLTWLWRPATSHQYASWSHGPIQHLRLPLLLLLKILIIIFVRPGGGCPLWRTGGSWSSIRFPRL